MKTGSTFTCCFLAVICVSQFASAGFILESAAGDTTSSALGIGDYNFVMHRFKLETRTRIGSIGGYFDSYLQGKNPIFGAIVSLTSQYDQPDSIDLSTPDVLATTRIYLDDTPGDYYGKIDKMFNTGWYALVFGTGKFGAASFPYPYSGSHVRMPNFTIDLSPQMDNIMLLPDHPYKPNEFLEVNHKNASRFLVNTKAIPEPASLLLLGIGAAALTRRKA